MIQPDEIVINHKREKVDKIVISLFFGEIEKRYKLNLDEGIKLCSYLEKKLKLTEKYNCIKFTSNYQLSYKDTKKVHKYLSKLLDVILTDGILV